jgi:hypothetical protein
VSTGLCSAVDWCRLQWPDAISAGTAGASQDFYGRVYITGVTNQSDAVDSSPALVAELGIGPDGVDPSVSPDLFTWTAAQGNPNWSAQTAGEPGNDEYMVILPLPATGTYDFAFRFSNDYGQTWLYCDLDARSSGGGDGSADGYQVANAGSLTVQ